MQIEEDVAFCVDDHVPAAHFEQLDAPDAENDPAVQTEHEAPLK